MGRIDGELKGVILAGGKGSRLRPVTATLPKQLIPLANKPVIEYGIGSMVAAEIREIAVIVSPESGPPIRARLGDGSRFGARLDFIEQPRPAGLADAILCAEDWVDGHDFLVYLGDNIVSPGVGSLAESFRVSRPDAMVLLASVPDPRAFGVAEVEHGRVVRLVEKPQQPPSNLALVGVYLFSPAFFEQARRLQPSARGELEITEAIQHLIDDGAEVVSDQVWGWWKDTGTVEGLLEGNRRLLHQDFGCRSSTPQTEAQRLLQAHSIVEGFVDRHSTLSGEVIVEAGAEVINSVVAGPVLIGERARIVNSELRHGVSVAPDIAIVNSTIENSIVAWGPQREYCFQDVLCVANERMRGTTR